MQWNEVQLEEVQWEEVQWEEAQGAAVINPTTICLYRDKEEVEEVEEMKKN